ncbi:MAG: metal ABC transporter substrate-binding protein [Ignavibacteria bacterium]|nr:metal ABC transporter substrate-binding protein [Ignavibacteria bacterium]
MKKIVIVLIAILSMANVFAQVKVVTTTTVISDFVREIGKEKVKVDYICRGDQDPHFVEILPTYMLKIRNVDLFIKVGLGLEGWAQQLIDGSRNSKLHVVDLSENISKREVPTTKTDGSQGDVHPFGNPHYWLDPENAKIMVKEISEALIARDPANAAYYEKNTHEYLHRLDAKMKEWQAAMASKRGKKIITFHASWIYFCERYGIVAAGYVEPKPGIAPSPSHNADVINIVKNNGIKLILMENFYSDAAPNQIARLTGAKVYKTATAVGGSPQAPSYIAMMDSIIKAFDGI